MNLLEILFPKKSVTVLRRRVPLFIRTALPLFLFVTLLAMIFGSVFFSRFRNSLYSSEFEKGWLTLSHFGASAKALMLEADLFRLNTLTKEYSSEESVLFVALVDHQQTVLTHTDPSKVGGKYNAGLQDAVDTPGQNFVIYASSISGQQVYTLSQPLRYQDKFLGTAHLILSQLYVDRFVEAQEEAFLQSLYLPLLILLFFVFSLAIILTAWIKFQFYKLRTAIHALCRGDFNFQLEVSGNNEFTDLASEVRHLSNNLRQKEQMQTDVVDYLSCTTLDRILESPQKKGSSYASRRQVTVLYAGIAGFGEYASHTKAEEVVEALNEYIGIATNTILAHGGYVDKFMGDAVVGIFGVSVYREDHTKRAVRAAWEMQSVLRQHDKGSNKVLGKVRIGMSSGVVLSGNIGSVSRIEYSSIGESIKEAFWLNGFAEAKEIIISKSIYQLIKNDACVETLTPQKMIGHEGVLERYRLQSLNETSQANMQVAT